MKKAMKLRMKSLRTIRYGLLLVYSCFKASRQWRIPALRGIRNWSNGVMEYWSNERAYPN
jgi:hypothetical protein